MAYRQPTYGNLIQGLDLHLDEHTQRICETYNQSSAATRSVLYILLLVSIVALFAVFNTSPLYNWPSERIEHFESLKSKEDSLYNLFWVKLHGNPDSIRKSSPDSTLCSTLDSLDFHARKKALVKSEEDSFMKLNVDYLSVKVPIIGIQIDLNDLVAITALAFIILLYVLRFTLAREKNNLRLAFNSISERYPDEANFDVFYDEQIKLQSSKYFGKPPANNNLQSPWKIPNPLTGHTEEMTEESWRKWISDINFTRRRCHYNFLSMNEIFNMPFLDVSENKSQQTLAGKIVNKYVFYFYFLVYAYIMFNDFCSYDAGLAINPKHTFMIMTFSVVGFLTIYWVCQYCVNQKHAIKQLFSDFYHGQYFYDYDKTYTVEPSRRFFRWFLPFIILAALDFISLLFRQDSPSLLTDTWTKEFFKHVFFYHS